MCNCFKNCSYVQVQPADAWLRDESDDTVYLPDQAGNFDLDLASSYCTLIVEGPTSTGRAMTGAIMPSATARGSNTFSSLPTHSSSLAAGNSSVNIPGPPYTFVQL